MIRFVCEHCGACFHDELSFVTHYPACCDERLAGIQARMAELDAEREAEDRDRAARCAANPGLVAPPDAHAARRRANERRELVKERRRLTDALSELEATR